MMLLFVRRFSICLCTLMLPFQWVQAAAVNMGNLMQIERPALRASPLHQHEIKDVAIIDEVILNQLKVGQSGLLPLPDGGGMLATLQRKALPLAGEDSDTVSVFSLANNKGSVELMMSNGRLREYRYHDLSTNTPRVFRGDLGLSGEGAIFEADANEYFCIHMPGSLNVANAELDDEGGIALTQAPSVSELQSLQGRPLANKVLYINYWGGVVSKTAWNDVYNGGAPIAYEAFNTSGSASDFSENERYLMWLGWREAVEDYAQFDINVTTDQTVYDAAESQNRGMIIATPTLAWFGSAGGVAYLDGFGSGYRGTGWAWNDSASSLGQTISHEAGHLMDLTHDGGLVNTSYYSGHGEWGPIMGASFGRSYVQWSKGEYTGANNTEDDIAILYAKLGNASDLGGDASNPIFISTSSTLISTIAPRGNGSEDIDVFTFELLTPDTLTISVAPVMGLENEQYATNLSLSVDLLGPGASVSASAPLPYDPRTNLFSSVANLSSGSYTLTVKADSPDTSWSTGFGEYGNGGLYQLSISSSIPEADLIARLGVEDVEVFGGQTFAINSEIQNTGSAASSSTGNFSVYQSTDATVSASDTLIHTSVLPAVLAGSIHAQTVQVLAPNFNGTLWYAVCAALDTNETVEGNNCSQAVAVNFAQNSADIDIADALDTSDLLPFLDWKLKGAASFYRQTSITFDGVDAARTGNIGHDTLSYIELNVSGMEMVSFQWSVSSEADYDYFHFYVDGIEIEKISGELGWAKIQHELTTGAHTLKWAYIKDLSVANGSDAGFLDNVMLSLTDAKFSIITVDSAKEEGDSGSTAFTFAVENNGATTAVSSVDYTVTGTGLNSADANDFVEGLPFGVVNFSVGDSTANIIVNVSGDGLLEPDEGFLVALSNPIAGDIVNGSAVGAIVNDESDQDGDGIIDDADNCLTVANSDQINTDQHFASGDNNGDACDGDDDADNISDGTDNCPIIPNQDQTNTDLSFAGGDSDGDACDADDDADGVNDVIDNCSVVSNPAQLNTDLNFSNGDILGDACDSDDDADNSLDSVDNCPITPNTSQVNTDENFIGGDDLGDVCDLDDDADGLSDSIDNCSLIPNSDQLNTDLNEVNGDSFGDVCDDDDDADGWHDDDDNCPLVANVDQADTNASLPGGDACDEDRDGDGVSDALDNCPSTPNTDQAYICEMCFPISTANGGLVIVCF
jgi:hypothetical protein